MSRAAYLYLSDGSVFVGKSFGATATHVGELVFNTSMTGYQNILTDPSYSGQIINMTYPLIGNYGISKVDYQSEDIHAFGFACASIARHPSNALSVMTLGEWLRERGVPGIMGIDTRVVTKKVREHGTMKALIATEEIPPAEATRLLNETPLRTDYMKTAGVRETTTLGQGVGGDAHIAPPVAAATSPPRREPHAPEAAAFGQGTVGANCVRPPAAGGPYAAAAACSPAYRVAIIDYGIKKNIVGSLLKRGCEVHLLPYETTPAEIAALAPDGIFLSNGPGDPKAATHAIETVRALLGRYPIFGICLGHQIIALALGFDTFKLKFGHRGANHGVFDKPAGRGYITSQNHSYAVDPESIKDPDVFISHINLNDGTVEGLAHKTLPLFSVQFHPEGSPGPSDSDFLFDKFIKMMEENAQRKAEETKRNR